MPGTHPGSTSGIDSGGQGVIPRQFKRKKNFVTNERTDGRTNGWTDRRGSRNSYLDSDILPQVESVAPEITPLFLRISTFESFKRNQSEISLNDIFEITSGK